jgi:hypothetical protein
MKFKKLDDEQIDKEKINSPEMVEKSFSKKSLEVSHDKRLEDIFAISKLLDEMGFSRYHFLLFTITALILACGGIQEVMLNIVLSMVNEKNKLDEYQLAFFTTSEYIGLTSASIIVNLLTHYISNKLAIQSFSILTLIFTGVSIVGLNFYLTVFSRFFIGLSLGVLEVLLYQNLIESCPTRIRGFIGTFILLFSPLGSLVITLICYFSLIEGQFELNFRYLLLFPFIISSFTLLITLPFLEDSVRRMVAINNLQGSLKIIKKMSKFNKNDKFLQDNNEFITHIIRDELNNSEKREEHNKSANLNNTHNESFIYMIKMIFTQKYFKITLLLWTSSMLSGLLFNGVFYLVPTYALNLVRKDFKEVLISHSMEIPSILVASFLIEFKRLGRLRSLKLSNFMVTIISSLCLVMNKYLLSINFLLKFFSSITVNILVIYGSEIYEGRLRTFGISAINFWRRLATISSPFLVTYMSNRYLDVGPYYIFLPTSLLLFVLSLFFTKETRGISLEQIEIPIEGTLI